MPPIKTVTSLGIGVFDGLHIGHQKIAQKCSALLTFHPHPDQVLNKSKSIPYLTSRDEIQAFGIPILTQRFSKKLANLSAIEFLDTIVLKQYSPKKIVVGYDFVFGKNRLGTLTVLKSWAKAHQIEIVEVAAVRQAGEIVSSSRIRKLIMAGHLKDAVACLGHPYLISGKVIKGAGMGRQLGFPTANIMVDTQKCLPPLGVFRAKVTYKNREYSAAVYIGTKPTFKGKEVAVETYIFNFDHDIYGKKINLWIEDMVRPEMTFASKDELINQIKRDLKHCGIEEG